MALPEIDVKKLKKSAARLRAIAVPARLQIISLLNDNKELCVREITEKMEMYQGAVSLHLKILKNYDVLKCRKEGKWTYYSINSIIIQKILTLIDK